jgi:hypothetical protein
VSVLCSGIIEHMSDSSGSSATATLQDDSQPVELTVLMPCLNEAATLGACVAAAKSFLERVQVSGEILIADNGSTDGSQDIARSLHARVVDVQTRGYGAALLGGIAAARGRYVIMGDADYSYDFSKLDPFLAALRGGADLVMGNRFKGGIARGAMPALHRYVGNPVLSYMGRLFFRIPIGDFHCGLRGFRVDRLRELDLQTSGMEFASEMVVRSALSHFSIAEVPTTLRPDGRSRAPHLKTWRDGWRHLKFLLMYSPRWLFMVPGAALIVVGLLLALLVFPGPLRIVGGITLDTNTFIAATFMILLGVQLLTAGGISRNFATMAGFLPHSPRAEILVRHATTDRLAQLALVFAILGIGLFAYAILLWAEASFGPLEDPFVSRIIITGLMLTAISMQTFFLAFLLGIVAIPIRSREARSHA